MPRSLSEIAAQAGTRSPEEARAEIAAKFQTPLYPWGEPISPSSMDYPLCTRAFPGPGVDIWREYNRAELEWQLAQLRERHERRLAKATGV